MNPWRSLSSLPKPLWVIFGTTLINRAGTMALPFLVLYLTKHEGLTPSAAGLVLTAYGVGALATGPYAGRLSDRIGPVRIMKASLFLSGGILFLFPFLAGQALLLGVTVVWAVVSEAFRPASMALVTEVVRPGDRKIAISVIRLAVNVGMSVGPAVGGFLLLVSYDLVFWIDGGTSVAAGFLLILMRWEGHGTPPAIHAPSGSLRDAFAAFKDRRLVYFLLAASPIFMIFFQHESTVALYMVRDLGMDEHNYGLLFPVNTLLIILLEIPLNVAMVQWPHRKALMLGGFLVAAGFAATGLAWNFPSLVVTVVIWTFGEMILVPTCATFVADISPENRRGEYMGIYQMSFSLSFALSGWIGTTVYELWGAGTLWSAVFVTGLIAVVMISRMQDVPARIQLEGGRNG